LTPRPYAELAERLATTEEQVIERLRNLLDEGSVRRFGVVVRHRDLGYRANAMVVWDVPDDDVDEVANRLTALPYITLCYRRRRQLPAWPYNLFCMIHGRRRDEVEDLVERATVAAGLEGAARAVLFSRRRFKQRGARYAICRPAAVAAADRGA
jgi:DNA-binding Lrp family transcriptional regulator